MALKKAFNRAGKKLGIALSCLSLAFLAGCGPSPEHLGATAATPALQGTTISEQVFTGGPNMPHVTVDASALQSGHKYVFEGALTIKGNLPAKTIVEVDNGKLDITGNVGSQSEIDVKLPINTHDETSIILMPMVMSCGNNCTTTTLMPMPVTNTIIDGLTYPADHGAAVTVNGFIGNGVTITTNGSVHAAGWGTEFRVRPDYGATQQQVKPVQVAPAPRTAS